MTAKRRARVDGVLARRQPDLTVITENLHKPRNFSAMVRTCDSVGINALHVVTPQNSVNRHWHTSQGAEKWIDVVLHERVDTACKLLKSRGFSILGAHLSEQAVNYREVDYTQPTALLMGTERFGVSDEALVHVDQQISIPMMGMSQSLNVSVACAVVLYEALAQRLAAGMYDSRRLDDATYHRFRFEGLHQTLARYCRERGLAYPELDENGDLLSDPRDG